MGVLKRKVRENMEIVERSEETNLNNGSLMLSYHLHIYIYIYIYI